jgi:hypothetical protein
MENQIGGTLNPFFPIEKSNRSYACSFGSVLACSSGLTVLLQLVFGPLLLWIVNHICRGCCLSFFVFLVDAKIGLQFKQNINIQIVQIIINLILMQK